MSSVSAVFSFGTITGSECSVLLEARNTMSARRWWNTSGLLLSDEVDNAFETAEVWLGYFPDNFACTVFVVGSQLELDAVQIARYSRVVHKNVPAFASLSKNRVYVIGRKMSRKVMRHEFGHLLLHHALGEKRISSRVHEVVARFCEKEIK